MSTLHIRNVPPEVVEALRARAVGEGRSLNAQVVRVLTEAAMRQSLDEVLASIEERARGSVLPTGAPMPEALIRRDRDSD